MSESKQGIMDRFQGFMEEKILPFATKLGNQRHMAAIRDGMSILIPLTIIGGLAMILAIPPVPAGLENTNFFNGLLQCNPDDTLLLNDWNYFYIRCSWCILSFGKII